MSESNDQATDGGRKDRRNVLSLGLAAIAGVVATVASRGNIAAAGHDGTNIFHLGELNEAGTAPTRLHADVAISALGGPGPAAPPAATLMVSNVGSGFAVFAHANPGAAGGINGNASSTVGVLGTANSGTGVRGSSNSGAGVAGSSTTAAGVRGTSSTGPGVEALSPSATSPALVAQWTGDPNSPTPHSGIFGSTVALQAPGIHGQASQIGVLGRSGPPTGGEPLGNGIGVMGHSGNGPGVQGMSVIVGVIGLASTAGPNPQPTNGTGVRGQSGGGVGIFGKSEGGPGVRGESTSGAGVSAQSQNGPGVFASSVNATGLVAQSSAAQGVGLAGHWVGPADSPTPHSGVVGSSSGKAPGVHGTSRTLGVLGRAALQDPTAALTDGIGVLGQSSGGPGVQGDSQSGAGVQGRSTTGPGVRGVSPELGVFGGSPKVGVLGQAKLPPPSPDLSDGTGVLGQSKGGAGVRGHSSSGPGLDGFSDSAPGVRGASGSGPGVLGVANATNPGVVGSSTTPLAGVNGHTTSGGPAVHGIAQGPGRGVLGTALQAGGTGVVAENAAGGLALDVLGKARFATAGLAVIPADATSVSVTAPVNPATSLVLVTPLADTQRRALFVTMSAGSFSINLDDQHHPAIPVAWLIIEHT